MFESLQNGLQGALKTLRGQGKLTESNMRDGLKLVEQALLEADVSFPVVQQLHGAGHRAGVGEKVLKSLDPSQQLVRHRPSGADQPDGPGRPFAPPAAASGEVTVLMLCGLQGSGKTTTCGKLGALLKQADRTPLLVAADLQRPAAIDQLHVLGEQLGIPVYSDRGQQDPVAVCKAAVQAGQRGRRRRGASSTRPAGCTSTTS